MIFLITIFCCHISSVVDNFVHEFPGVLRLSLLGFPCMHMYIFVIVCVSRKELAVDERRRAS
jgi:hypothetical protein